jgi:hypothetical protein
MRLYPELPGRRFATVSHDVLLLVVLVLLAWLGLLRSRTRACAPADPASPAL